MTEDELKIEQLKEEIKKINAEKQRLEKELRGLTLARNTSNILESVTDINESNSRCIGIDKHRKTIEIMSSFYNSDKTFLILKYMFRIGKPYFTVSLIVTKPQNIVCIDSGLTMTDLKKLAGELIVVNEASAVSYKRENRESILLMELGDIYNKLKHSKKPVAFKHPICLGAQTHANRTGYGSEYNGNTLVHKGTLYGATTCFLIIGAFRDEE